MRDNQYVEPPAAPEDGYHLTEDLARTAIRYVQDQKQAAPDRPFFLYFPLGAMHAPHHVAPEWVEPYRGRFDGGWERWRERGVRAPARARRRARRHGAPRTAAVGTGLGHAQRRRASGVRALPRGVRRLPHAHRRTDRAGRVVPRGDRRARQHPRDARVRQRHERRGRRDRDVQRAPLHVGARPTPSRRTSSGSTSSAASVPTTTTRGDGRGRATRRCACGSGTRGSAGSARRSSCTGPTASRRGARCATQFVPRDRSHAHRARRVRNCAAGHARRCHATADRRREHQEHVRRRAVPRTRAPCSTSRCSAHVRSCTTTGRPPPTTCRRAWSTKSVCSWEAATSTPTGGSSSTSPTTSPRPPTSPTSIPRSSRDCKTCGSSKPRATRCSRSSTVSSRGSPPRYRRRTRPRRAASTGPRAVPSPTIRCRVCSAGSA